MVKYTPDILNGVFSALSDPTRRAILEHLARGEASVMEVAEPFLSREAMSLPAISKHVRILEEAGLIVRRREGRVHHLTLAAARMQEAADWLAQYREFWEAQLDLLDTYLKTQPENGS